MSNSAEDAVAVKVSLRSYDYMWLSRHRQTTPAGLAIHVEAPEGQLVAHVPLSDDRVYQS